MIQKDVSGSLAESTTCIIRRISVFTALHQITELLAATLVLQYLHTIQPVLYVVVLNTLHHGRIPLSYAVEMDVLAFQIIQASKGTTTGKAVKLVTGCLASSQLELQAVSGAFASLLGHEIFNTAVGPFGDLKIHTELKGGIFILRNDIACSQTRYRRILHDQFAVFQDYPSRSGKRLCRPTPTSLSYRRASAQPSAFSWSVN